MYPGFRDNNGAPAWHIVYRRGNLSLFSLTTCIIISVVLSLLLLSSSGVRRKKCEKSYPSHILVFCLYEWGLGMGKELEVKVNLNKAKEAVFSSSGGLKIEIGKRYFSVPSSYPVHFREKGGKVEWEEENILSSEVYIYPKGKEPILWGKRPYRGSFIVKASSDGILVINQLPVEDYIKGTMKLELSPAWPVEALKAQIIVSRTYALKNLRRHEEEGFNFCATDHCQRYGELMLKIGYQSPGGRD